MNLSTESSSTDEIVTGLMARWTAAFGRLDADELSLLYAKQALFFGSNPTLYRGREGVAAYFNGLPRWKSPTVRFSDVATSRAGSDVISVAATACFNLDPDTEPLTVKLTWVILREDGDWKIVSHHVSSTTALIAPANGSRRG